MDTTTTGTPGTPGPADTSTTPGAPGETFQLTAELAEAYEAHFVPAFFAQWAPPCSTRRASRRPARPGRRLRDRDRRPHGRWPGRSRWRGHRPRPPRGDAGRSAPDSARPHLAPGGRAALPFESGTFDAVLSQMALMFFPDPAGRCGDGAGGPPRRGRGRPDPRGHRPQPLPAFRGHRSPPRRPRGARALVGTYFALGDRARLVGLFSRLAGVQATSPTGKPLRLDRPGSGAGGLNQPRPLGGRLEPACGSGFWRTAGWRPLPDPGGRGAPR